MKSVSGILIAATPARNHMSRIGIPEICVGYPEMTPGLEIMHFTSGGQWVGEKVTGALSAGEFLQT